MQDEALVPITKVISIEMVKPSGDAGANIAHLFAVANHRLVAVDHRRVLRAAPSDERASMRLRVTAVDAAGVWHSNIVEFRIEPQR